MKTFDLLHFRTFTFNAIELTQFCADGFTLGDIGTILNFLNIYLDA